jgi:hypothetical protein
LSAFDPSRPFGFVVGFGFDAAFLSFLDSAAFGFAASTGAFAAGEVLGAEVPEFFCFSWAAPVGGGAVSAGAAVTLGAMKPKARRAAQTPTEDGLGRRILDFVTVESELVKS